MGVSISGGYTDNKAIGETRDATKEMRDLLKESKKQSKYMLWLTITIMVLTIIQIALLLTK